MRLAAQPMLLAVQIGAQTSVTPLDGDAAPDQPTIASRLVCVRQERIEIGIGRCRRAQLFEPLHLPLRRLKGEEHPPGCGEHQRTMISEVDRKPERHGAFRTGDEHDQIIGWNHQSHRECQLIGQLAHLRKSRRVEVDDRSLTHAEGEELVRDRVTFTTGIAGDVALCLEDLEHAIDLTSRAAERPGDLLRSQWRWSGGNEFENGQALLQRRRIVAPVRLVTGTAPSRLGRFDCVRRPAPDLRLVMIVVPAFEHYYEANDCRRGDRFPQPHVFVLSDQGMDAKPLERFGLEAKPEARSAWQLEAALHGIGSGLSAARSGKP